MSKVLIINDSGHNMEDAQRYGELIIMSEGLVDKFDVSSMLRLFNPYIDQSDAEDFILVSGPTVMCAVACAVFAARHGCLNLLLWRFERNGQDRYVHHRVTLKR